MLIKWHHSSVLLVALTSAQNFWKTLCQSLHPADCSDIRCWDIWSVLHPLHGIPQPVLRKALQVPLTEEIRQTHIVWEKRALFPFSTAGIRCHTAQLGLLEQPWPHHLLYLIFYFSPFSPPKWAAHSCITLFLWALALLIWCSYMLILAFASDCW